MDTIRPQARRPAIIADIVLDGWAESARRVYRKLRNLQKMRLMVWVDSAGSVWTKGLSHNDGFNCPEGQHLATYAQDVPINEVEDDMLFHLRDMTGTRKAA